MHIGRTGTEICFKKSFKVPARVVFSSSKAGRGKITGCRACPSNSGWQTASGFCAEEIPAMRAGFPVCKWGWSPSTIAQLEISFFQPVQFAAQTMELNMPRSGCGFSMRSCAGKSSRSNSAASAASFGRWTTAICAAPSSRHCRRMWPMTVVSPHGSSNLGRPIRDDAPAPRMMTPKADFSASRIFGFPVFERR